MFRTSETVNQVKCIPSEWNNSMLAEGRATKATLVASPPSQPFRALRCDLSF
ncbi:hypothetical protein J6590_045431 [Homalodisca vitripennis]|nr:hypothetical protein J6590_045431 [Homalodisca vitripennis]